MKYKYNNEWKEMNVKVSDTLPIGSVVEYDGEVAPPGWEEMNAYSTDEIKTGDTWINGKPIYRKVINNIAMSNVTQTVNTGISNLENVIKIDAYVKYSATTYSVISAGYVFNYSEGVITISPLSNFLNLSSYTGYIIIEYTKTTD